MRTLLVALLLIGSCSAQILSGQHRKAGSSFSGHYLDAISGSGSDSANGLTPSTAWATLAHADATLSTNDPVLHIRYPDGNYYLVAPIWHNMLSYYPMQQGTLGGLSATTCYDVYNSHNAAFTGTGVGSNGPIWKYGGLVITNGARCAVANYSNLMSGPGAVISAQSNFFNPSTSTWNGSSVGMDNGGTFLWLASPHTGTAFFDFTSSISFVQDPVALAFQPHIWGGVCDATHQYYYLDATQKATATNTCAYAVANQTLNLGYDNGVPAGMAGILSGTMITAQPLATSDYLTIESWFNATELPRITHAPTPVQPGPQTKPSLEWDAFAALGTSATCAQVKANALAATTNGIQGVGYDTFSFPIPWATGRDVSNNLIADVTKCPLGMADLVTYLHGLGFKAKCWLTPGTTGFSGQPGSGGFETNDAASCAGFGVDSIYYDLTTAIGSVQTAYQTMSTAMIATGRPMAFEVLAVASGNQPYWCSAVGGADGQTGSGAAPQTWTDVVNDAAATDSFSLLPWATTKPLCFPWIDSLGIGNGTLTDQEGQSQMAIWSTFGSALPLGDDLTGPPSATTLVTTENVEVIHLAQDTTGQTFGFLPEQFACGGANLCQVRIRQVFDLLGNSKYVMAITNQAGTSQSVTIHWDTGTALAEISGSYFRRDLWGNWAPSGGSTCTALSPGYSCGVNLDSSPITGATGFTISVPSHGTFQIALCSSQCSQL